MKRIAIFVSGSGTNAENIIRHFNYDKEYGSYAKVELVLSNRPDAYAITRACRLEVPSFVFTADMLKSGTVSEILGLYKIDIIILAGFLLKIPDRIISDFENRIINIHPALLPAYGGKGMYGHHVHEAVIRAGEKESGITVHLANGKYDDGTILFQAKCNIAEHDDAESLAGKIHELEQRYFPEVILNYIKGI